MAVQIRGSGGTVTVQSRAQTVAAVSQRYEVGAKSSVIVGGVPYAGAYEVTPTQDAQELPTAGRSLSQNVVVNPIPSNYGLIEWDGSKLRVS